jgi:radical SAM-linked protein
MVQVNLPYYPARIKFKKIGDLQYISHLDLVRTMQKALKRAGLSMWYTEGFNPKPKMVFGPPLSIGVESECEFLDIRLLRPIDANAIMKKLERALPPELAAIEIYEPKSSLTDIEWLSYTVTVISSKDGVPGKLSSFFEREEINVVKKGKRGETVVNIRPLIKNVTVTELDGGAKVECILASSSMSFLNPEHLIRAIKDNTDIFSGNLLTERYTVIRRSAYLADMTEFR